MIKRKRKGFTIVELVIVIAVIAVLAAVLIPTFASIIARANQSADIQAVRQMNVALATESVISPPKTLKEVIKILSTAGYNAEDKLVPVSKDHGFYWSAEANMITLIRDAGDESPELIFPTEETAVNTAFEAAKTKSAINFGANKADESDARTFFDLGEKAEEILEKIEQEASAGEGIKTAADLKAALETGGTFQLGDNIVVNESMSIEVGKTATIDLAGYTLTVHDSSSAEEVINVSGSLTIQGTGKVVLNADYSATGIKVSSGGSLNIENVDVDGSYCWNIENYGTTTLDKVKVTVPGGYGFANSGTATISNCMFIANGSNICSVYNCGGTMSITETEFSKGSAFVSYDSGACGPIKSSGGTLTLTGVTDDDTSADEYSVFAADGSSVVVKSGTYNTKFLCSGDTTTVTIYGGSINGVAYDSITDDSEIFIGADFTLTQGEGCWVISKPQT